MSRLIFLLLLLGSSVAMTRSDPVLRARSESVSRLHATPIILDAAGGRTHIGPLRFVRGWALNSPDPRFGGISAMGLTRGGLVALSDSGTVMWIAGRDRAPAALRLLPLPAGPGDSQRKADRDSEALATDPAGRKWVAYERHNAIWRYSADFRRVEASRAPPEMSRWRANSGAEAMLRLPDGRFLILSEGAGSVPRSSDVLLFDRDPTDAKATAARMSFRLPRGFAVTDAALLPDGRVMTLHRRVSIRDGITASVGIVPPGAFTPGAVVAPRIVATLRPPLTVDNMEALAVEQVGRETRIWIASDDNFSSLQRTLLMRFVLETPVR